MAQPDKTYLGDGVYAEAADGMIKLTTNYGIMDTNIIYLEPEVYEALLLWVKNRAENRE